MFSKLKNFSFVVVSKSKNLGAKAQTNISSVKSSLKDRIKKKEPHPASSNQNPNNPQNSSNSYYNNPNNNQGDNNDQGYSLIEFLITLGIVAVFVVVALPYYESYLVKKEKTKIDKTLQELVTAASDCVVKKKFVKCDTLEELKLEPPEDLKLYYHSNFHGNLAYNFKHGGLCAYISGDYYVGCVKIHENKEVVVKVFEGGAGDFISDHGLCSEQRLEDGYLTLRIGNRFLKSFKNLIKV